jgi:hypothetical protein
MKSDDVRLGRHLNLEIWKHGIKNPPPRIKITTQKDDKGIVRAELHGKQIELHVEKSAEKKGVMSKVAEAITKPGEKRKTEAKTAETKPAGTETGKPMPGTKPEPAKHVPLKSAPATAPQATPVKHEAKHVTPALAHQKPAQPVTKEELKSGETQIEDAMKKLAEKTSSIKKEKK